MYFTFFKKRLTSYQVEKGYVQSDKDLISSPSVSQVMDENMFAKAERMFYCYYQFLMDAEQAMKIDQQDKEPDSDDEYRGFQ